jgi:hypothetical protein
MVEFLAFLPQTLGILALGFDEYGGFALSEVDFQLVPVTPGLTRNNNVRLPCRTQSGELLASKVFQEKSFVQGDHQS